MIGFVREKLITARIVINKKRYTGKKGFYVDGKLHEFPTTEQGNDIIREKILSGDPIMVARHGSIELAYVTMSRNFKGLQNNAGFFPADLELGKRFRSEYLKHCEQMDVLCAWNYSHGFYKEEQHLFSLSSNCALATLHGICGPQFRKQPWTSALAGKKVVVIHPFAETIEKQYQRRALLHTNPLTLPDFKTLHTIKAVQSIAGEKVPFDNWFEALAHMHSQLDKLDFEVALIACGAYGLPLASYVKSMGRQGIHVGGTLQLLFGIKGKRWNGLNGINDAWVSPSEAETPKQARLVEDGCYWS